MANQEQLERLLDGGVEEWNKWREANPEVMINLSEANLRFANLSSVNLSSANLITADLRSANLYSANLRSANLSSANLNSANLNSANFISASLRSASLNSASLRSANLISASLISASLSSASLSSANFRYANLRFTNLRFANLLNTNLEAAKFHYTILSNVSLLEAIGLDKIKHDGPSELGQQTLRRSRGQLPKIFLKGCGLSDWEITASKLYNLDLSPIERTDLLYEIDRLQTEKPFHTRQVFISYTEADGRFVDRIEQNFDAQGIRFWRDVHHATAGPIGPMIERAIDHSPVFLLILSERSVNSDWVEAEVTKARELEKDKDQHIICPIAIDDSWKTSRWSRKLRTQIEKYNILDFSQWEDEAQFEKEYTKLLDGLNLFYLRG